LSFRKDARLMRRRYPMAHALGALAFIVLAIIGLARPVDPTPWLIAILGGAAIYGIALGRRLHVPPIVLPRVSATLPVTPAATSRAKVAWVAAWWTIFLIVPTSFAIARTHDYPDFALLGAATIVIVAAARRRQ